MGFRTPPTYWTILKKRIEEHAITRAPTGSPFKLASGQESNYYVDMRLIPLLHGSAAKECGMALVNLIPTDYRYVGAVPTGGLILLPMVLANRSNQLSGFYVRKEAKTYGASKRVEGHFGSDAPALMIEDTVTSGGSLIEAIEVAREAGIQIDLAIAMFDREQGAAENLARIGVELRAVFKARDFDL